MFYLQTVLQTVLQSVFSTVFFVAQPVNALIPRIAMIAMMFFIRLIVYILYFEKQLTLNGGQCWTRTNVLRRGKIYSLLQLPLCELPNKVVAGVRIELT